METEQENNIPENQEIKKELTSMQITEEIVSELIKPNAYNHEINMPVKVIRTAVSIVFLTGSYAYKICKPVNFGYLDFSTLEKRKKSCTDELELNKLISPELYVNIITINKAENGELFVNGEGEIVEYAIKMKQVDNNQIMSSLLSKDEVTSEHVKKLANIIYDYHKVAKTSPEISEYGSLSGVKLNCDENFEQTDKYKEKIISYEDFNVIKEKVNKFISENKELFEKRVIENKIKHCHGDFHSGNVFIVNGEPIIFDAIVFNKRFPCSDIIAEIAFMAMDLDYHGKHNLAEEFIATYCHLSQDEDIYKLLNFYLSYRAYVRGKVNCFISDDSKLDENTRNDILFGAKKYFNLAKKYAEKF
ncbi:hypothetical protein HN385_04300 [archaeon]|mgnify:FL=1|jgi:uncharacterized protein|nr:hypothetical protein [archaeon]MBT3450464.1 hypothetical protein [archaeon]MBT6868979.1 hypothetical protein [archaeon]MBT7193245.1 hypothetical protein [archaeon]MBT7380100.1 hypothetical protein [archaeon]